MAALYIAATPIGNLEDITYRAVRILREAAIIAAEDTRQTRKLLNHYNISPSRLLSCRAHNEAESAKGIIKLLDEGKDTVYVSEAGTPCISDPGARLVQAVREAGHSIVPIPGVSAVTALISTAGTIGKGFRFEGFLSPKSGQRRKCLTELLNESSAFILYESPYRIIKLLEELNTLAPKRNIFMGREITKKFEEFLSGSPQELLTLFQKRDKIKGEIALLVEKE
ncbi:MAG: 16S rRNA (cytidine(1402)-2'-O)-methyltransferase [Spirochaeta sp. LUC14_002_19_P3]|nr:MAG: 16S rRNA (cytidine(1402)-2'-O)-methyltransferase [Spirochaeta sp. LUC14_002_19_P3]